MNTNNEHRLIVVVPLAPAAQFTGLRTFWANTVVQPGDGADDPANWLGLNAAGDASAATHRWWSGAVPDAICKAILVRVCQLAAVALPTTSQWDNATPQQKIAWLASVRTTLRAATGIYLDLVRQQGAWQDPAAVLAAVGLKVAKTGP